MIRPIDLQTAILSTQAQNVPPAQRAEEGPRLAAQAAQAAFAAQSAERDETVAPTSEVEGNRIGAKPDEGHARGGGQGARRERTPFGEVVEEAAGDEDPPHIVDFTA